MEPGSDSQTDKFDSNTVSHSQPLRWQIIKKGPQTKVKSWVALWEILCKYLGKIQGRAFIEHLIDKSPLKILKCA